MGFFCFVFLPKVCMFAHLPVRPGLSALDVGDSVSGKEP